MYVEEYLLMLTMLSRYAPSLPSNPRKEMSRFLTSVANFVKDKGRTSMLHNHMNLSSLMVYSQTMEESKHSRISRNLKRSGFN